MRIQLNYVVLPTPELQALNERWGMVHHAAEEGLIWQSSEHHTVREHTRAQVEEAIWVSFLGNFDLQHLDSIGVDVRPFLRECIKLGFRGCFVIHEVMPPRHADELMRGADELRERACRNIAALS